MFSTETSKCTLSGKVITGEQIRPGLRLKFTEQYWKSIWEREPSHNSNAQWLVDLRTVHNNLPEQEPVTITIADIRQRVSGMKSRTASGLDMIHTDWLKKLIALHERLAAQMNQLLMDVTHHD